MIIICTRMSFTPALKLDDSFTIVGYQSDTESPLVQRLTSFGIVPGTSVIVRRVAPLGDPIQISVRGIELNLRRKELNCLILEYQTDQR